MADTIICVTTEKEAAAVISGKIRHKEPLLILGRGSNILLTSDYRGTVIIPGFRRTKIERTDGEHIIVSAGAGIEWDRFVEWTVNLGLCGLENLSGIPGNAGAVPVQNIGAYGREVKDNILKVRTLNTKTGKVRVFKADECDFGYRASIFKTAEKGNYLITRVWFRLALNFSPDLNYGTLKQEVEKSGDPTLRSVRNAVLAIRNSKLPDPEIIGNAGSFFKNPVVKREKSVDLKRKFPQMPSYDDPSGGVKLAAGWMIEQCGWKGKRIGDAGVHDKQALVLVNYGNATGKEIFDLSERIRKSVKTKFGINLEREVEVI